MLLCTVVDEEGVELLEAPSCVRPHSVYTYTAVWYTSGFVRHSRGSVVCLHFGDGVCAVLFSAAVDNGGEGFQGFCPVSATVPCTLPFSMYIDV